MRKRDKDINNEYKRWLEYATANSAVTSELKTMGTAKIEDAFYLDLDFGTGGLRGVIGAGTNHMNVKCLAWDIPVRRSNSARLIFSREKRSPCSDFISSMACDIMFFKPLLLLSFMSLLSLGCWRFPV